MERVKSKENALKYQKREFVLLVSILSTVLLSSVANSVHFDGIALIHPFLGKTAGCVPKQPIVSPSKLGKFLRLQLKISNSTQFSVSREF